MGRLGKTRTKLTKTAARQPFPPQIFTENRYFYPSARTAPRHGSGPAAAGERDSARHGAPAPARRAIPLRLAPILTGTREKPNIHVSIRKKTDLRVRIRRIRRPQDRSARTAQGPGRHRAVGRALLGDHRRRPPPLLAHLPVHPADRLHPVSLRLLRAVEHVAAQGALLPDASALFPDLDTLSEHHRLVRHRIVARLGDADRHHAAAAGLRGDGHHREMARERQVPPVLRGLSLHGSGLHLHLRAGLLRLRGAGESQARCGGPG